MQHRFLEVLGHYPALGQPAVTSVSYINADVNQIDPAYRQFTRLHGDSTIGTGIWQ